MAKLPNAFSISRNYDLQPAKFLIFNQRKVSLKYSYF